MHYNPCGRAVDMARRPYTTLARPFANSDRTVRIRWYPARPEDPTLPFPSRICSLDWMTDRFRKEGVGEVYGESRNYNAAQPIVGPHTNHVCGSAEDFANGEQLDETRPRTGYNRNGLPECCGIPDPPAVADLGVVAVATSIRSDPYRRRANVSITPVAINRRFDPRHAVPGVSVSVVSQAVTTPPTPARPGVSITPVSTVRRDDPHHAIAGVSITAVATATTEVIDPHPFDKHCSLAGMIAFDFEYTAPVAFDNPGLAYAFFNVTSGQSYHVTMTHFGAGTAINVYEGGDCGSKVLLFTLSGEGCGWAVASADTRWYVEVVYDAILPDSLKLVAGEGPC